MFSARTLTQTQHKPLPLLEKKKEKVWVELFPRCYKYRRERTSALQSEAWSVSANRWASRYSCSHTSSTGYLRVYSPVDQHTHTAATTCQSAQSARRKFTSVRFLLFLFIFLLVVLFLYACISCSCMRTFPGWWKVATSLHKEADWQAHGCKHAFLI